MKITKKQPLRPRGRSEEKRQSTKNAIRDAYINGPQKEVQIIPAKRDVEAETEKKKLRVCAYCRVSTDEDTQASSYELQVQNYTRMIRENPEWEFAGIFADATVIIGLKQNPTNGRRFSPIFLLYRAFCGAKHRMPL